MGIVLKDRIDMLANPFRFPDAELCFIDMRDHAFGFEMETDETDRLASDPDCDIDHSTLHRIPGAVDFDVGLVDGGNGVT